MTVVTTSNKTIVLGNGVTTVFSFNFDIPESGDEQITYTDAAGTSTVLSPTLYTITGFGVATGGTLTYPLVGSPIAAGTQLTIARILPITQEVSFSNQGAVYLNVTETAFDTVVMQIQQIDEAQNRNITAPITDPNAPLSLPSATARANLLFGFDASGNPTAVSSAPAGVISSAMAPVVAASTLAAGRTALGLGTGDSPTFTGLTLSGSFTTALNGTITGNVSIGGTLGVANQVTVTWGNSTSGNEVIKLVPTDFGGNKPYFFVKKTSSAQVWDIGLWDGIDVDGTINFAQTTMTHLSNSILDVSSIATQAEQEAASSTAKLVTPGRQQFHPSAAKAWALIVVTATVPALTVSYNITSISDDGVGLVGVVIATDFSSANWGYSIAVGTPRLGYINSRAAGTCQLSCLTTAGAANDPTEYSFSMFGDQ